MGGWLARYAGTVMTSSDRTSSLPRTTRSNCLRDTGRNQRLSRGDRSKGHRVDWIGCLHWRHWKPIQGNDSREFNPMFAKLARLVLAAAFRWKAGAVNRRRQTNCLQE